jgi:acid phosphatase
MILTCALAGSLGAQTGGSESAASWPEPENHAIVVERLLRYHDSGEYEWRIQEVANAAREYLQTRAGNASPQGKLAAIFDIDETALSNWHAMADCGFCSYAIEAKLYPIDHDPAITPVLELFNAARKSGVAVFFLTGRPNAQRDLTIKNLNEVG